MTWFILFGAATLGDICWTRFIQAVAEKRRIPATFWSGSIALVGVVNLLGVIESPWNATATVLGAAAGTYAAFFFDS